MKALRPLGHAGFTIVETMIVLGVAGLILLVVFEAVPTLQRSSRNSQRKQDVQTILQAVSHYELNDSGKFPDDCGGDSHPACTATGGSTPNDYFLRFSGHTITYYTGADQVVARNQTSETKTNQGPNTDINTVDIYNYELCNRTGGAASYFGAGYSDIVALYALETGNGGTTGTPQCQQL
ncbi:MAG TPA: type II secretion system protein [Candidatus Saccharimonadales bacterium]|nr:type II secretion system protein [Candidatus Saccharimonadales bacterium]